MALPTGIEMQYVEAGNTESDGVIVLLHGYTDSSRSFYPTIEALLALDSDLTAGVRRGTWLGAAKALLEIDNTAALANLQVDSLVLWATQDVIFPAGDQQELRAALDAAAAACRSGYTWKQYGREPLPAEGQTDLGHNTQWGPPAGRRGHPRLHHHG